MLFVPRAYAVLDKLERGELNTSWLLLSANKLSHIGEDKLAMNLLDWAALSSVLWEVMDIIDKKSLEQINEAELLPADKEKLVKSVELIGCRNYSANS